MRWIAGSRDLCDPLAIRGLGQPSAELLRRLLNIERGLMGWFAAGEKAMTCKGGEFASLTLRANRVGNRGGAAGGRLMRTWGRFFAVLSAYFWRTFGVLYIVELAASATSFARERRICWADADEIDRLPRLRDTPKNW